MMLGNFSDVGFIPNHHLAPVLVGAIFLTGFVYLYRQAYLTNVPYIPGIPEAPGAVAFYGHLKILGDDQPTTFEKWGVQNNWPVIQARFGTQRVLVLNTFEAAQAFIVKNASATIGRPLFWTFHHILSTTQGPTIGTSPWDGTTKKRRTAVSAYLTRPAIQKSGPMLDTESYAFINDMYEATANGARDVNPEVYTKRLALNLTMMICYGTRFDDVTDPMLLNILDIAETVSTFRSTNKNLQDYVPLLRYLLNSERSALANQVRQQRDDWLDQSFATVEDAVKHGKSSPCITESLLKQEGKTKLTMDDIKCINVSLVSGGFETLATTSSAALGLLASPKGQLIQDRAFEDLMKHYGTVEEAWKMVITEEKSDYFVALAREMLRYFAAIQFLPPRLVEKEFVWNGVTVPKGTTVIQNAQAINHDKSFYGEDADVFRPERWMASEENNVPPPPAPYHFSFGAGSRACPAVAISNRVLYSTFARLIMLFRILPAENGALLDTDYVRYNRDTTFQTCKPKAYRVRLAPRDKSLAEMKSCFTSSRTTTPSRV